MRKAEIKMHSIPAALLTENEDGTCILSYFSDYKGEPVSLTLPVRQESYHFDRFPLVFEGWLPEGMLLEALLKNCKLDRNDFWSQLMATGADLVGAVTVFPIEDES